MRLTRETTCHACSRKERATTAAEQVPHLRARPMETRSGQSRAPVRDDSSLVLWFLWRRVFRPGAQVDIADISGRGRKGERARDLPAFMLDGNGVSTCRQIAENVSAGRTCLHLKRKLFQA